MAEDPPRQRARNRDNGCMGVGGMKVREILYPCCSPGYVFQCGYSFHERHLTRFSMNDLRCFPANSLRRLATTSWEMGWRNWRASCFHPALSADPGKRLARPYSCSDHSTVAKNQSCRRIELPAAEGILVERSCCCVGRSTGA